MHPLSGELTVHQAWYLAHHTEAGDFPSCLGIMHPCFTESKLRQFTLKNAQELSAMGVIDSSGNVLSSVKEWIKIACRPLSYLQLLLFKDNDCLRGIIVKPQMTHNNRTDLALVVLRNAQLITFTWMQLSHPHDFAQIIFPLCQESTHDSPHGSNPTSRYSGEALNFAPFTIDSAVGNKVDQMLRKGLAFSDALEMLNIPSTMTTLLESTYEGPRNFLEITAVEHDNAINVITPVCVNVLFSTRGPLLITPEQEMHGGWRSTYSPLTRATLGSALSQLTSLLPSGSWFSEQLVKKYLQ